MAQTAPIGAAAHDDVHQRTPAVSASKKFRAGFRRRPPWPGPRGRTARPRNSTWTGRCRRRLGLGDDVHGKSPRLRSVTCDKLSTALVSRSRHADMHAGAGLQHRHHHADDQRQGGEAQKVGHGLAEHAAHGAKMRHAGDAGDYGQEDHRAMTIFTSLMKASPQKPSNYGAVLRLEILQQHAQHNGPAPPGNTAGGKGQALRRGGVLVGNGVHGRSFVEKNARSHGASWGRWTSPAFFADNLLVLGDASRAGPRAHSRPMQPTPPTAVDRARRVSAGMALCMLLVGQIMQRRALNEESQDVQRRLSLYAQALVQRIDRFRTLPGGAGAGQRAAHRAGATAHAGGGAGAEPQAGTGQRRQPGPPR